MVGWRCFIFRRNVNMTPAQFLTGFPLLANTRPWKSNGGRWMGIHESFCWLWHFESHQNGGERALLSLLVWFVPMFSFVLSLCSFGHGATLCAHLVSLIIKDDTCACVDPEQSPDRIRPYSNTRGLSCPTTESCSQLLWWAEQIPPTYQ